MHISFTHSEKKLEILLNHSVIGFLEFQKMNINDFVLDYLDFYREQYSSEELQQSFLLEQKLKNKDFIYFITYFKINENFRNNKYGTILFEKFINDKKTVFLNASYSTPNFPLPNLINFYKKYHFKSFFSISPYEEYLIKI